MDILELLNRPWQPPELPADIPHGDMPGDKVVIGAEHIAKANKLFPPLLALLGDVLSASPARRGRTRWIVSPNRFLSFVITLKSSLPVNGQSAGRR